MQTLCDTMVHPGVVSFRLLITITHPGSTVLPLLIQSQAAWGLWHGTAKS
jgi:hypothetical protein